MYHTITNTVTYNGVLELAVLRTPLSVVWVDFVGDSSLPSRLYAGPLKWLAPPTQPPLPVIGQIHQN